MTASFCKCIQRCIVLQTMCLRNRRVAKDVSSTQLNSVRVSSIKQQGFHEAVCDFCLKHHLCNERCKEKPKDEFKPSSWKLRFSQKIVCRQCESTGKFC
eukprot:6716212-Karenia_brevis.AAC.1